MEDPGRSRTGDAGQRNPKEREMTKIHVLSVSAVVVLASAIAVRAQMPRPAADRPTVLAASELKWMESATMKGAKQAVLWGDPMKGAFGVMKSVSGGAVLPMHWHTHPTRFVILAGTIQLTVEGSAAKDLPPQSFGSIPGGVKHMAKCMPGAECVYLETGEAAYDFKAVEPAASR
jgi:quercetin dioxygenase-like cupin family protein